MTCGQQQGFATTQGNVANTRQMQGATNAPFSVKEASMILHKKYLKRSYDYMQDITSPS